MITYDFLCRNGHEQIDVRCNYGDRPACPTCGAATEILWKSSFPNVIGDECFIQTDNMTGEMETFTSKSEHRRIVKERGFNIRDHYVPGPHGDRNRNVAKWY